MIYVLLGMHKSGTTLLSQILQESGIHMGNFDESKGYDEGNKYERLETHDLNIEILGCAYKEHSLNISNVLSDIRKLKPEVLSKAKNFITTAESEHKEWGFKDPRTCLTYNVWKEILPAHKIIAIYRHPSELWSHYRRQKIWQIFNHISICWKSLHAWYVYNREVLEVLKETRQPFFLTEYHEFMTNDKIFQKLCSFTGMKLKDSRNSSLYRSKKGTGPLFNLILGLHKVLFGRDIMVLYTNLKKYPPPPFKTPFSIFRLSCTKNRAFHS